MHHLRFLLTILGFPLCLSALLTPCLTADIPTTIKPVAAGLGGFNYWTSSPFADTAHTGGAWIEFGPDQWGNEVFLLNTDGTPNPQFNSKGLPKYLNADKKLRLLLWPYDVNSSGNPADWPKPGIGGAGKWVVTWQGNADIRLSGATFVSGESNGAATGLINNGRRVYQMAATNPTGHIIVEAITSEVTDLKVWLPDPANPTAQSLETSGNFWHPWFLANIAAVEFGSLRFMDWGDTNQSPQMDWIDRRLPEMVFQRGVLNRRSPAPGVTNNWVNVGDRNTGMAYEHMISLANATGKDPWICVPHMATDDYVTKLAQLIRYGSDGVNPYTSPQANPVWRPLNPSLKVWLEYSNEIWSNGYSFPQGDWAQAQANSLGISKAVYNARRFSQVWSRFQQVFGGSQRIVRVGAIWTGLSSYTAPFMSELKNYGPTLSPPVEPDIIAPTTYFGNGIQDWVYEQANDNRFGTADQTWFHTAGDFTDGSTTRPVSKPLSDPYWTSPKLATDISATFDEWKNRIFSGSSVGGGGFDTTGVNGGFDAALAQSILTTFGKRLPIISYEGGPSLYVDYYDGGDVRDDGITNFAILLNRKASFAEIYRIQLNMARAKGLDCHGMFVDVARPGKYGQWGHLEYPGQPYAEAPKWQAVVDWGDDMLNIRNPLFPVGAVPTFSTTGTLPQGAYLQPYSTDIVATGGNVASGSALEWSVIGSLLAPGLTIAPVPGDPTRYRLSGTPGRGGWSYVYLRVNDDDGDAVWQVFSMYVPGGPGTLLESRIVGNTTAASLPYTAAQAIDSTLITWSGLNRLAPAANGGGSALLPGNLNYPDGTGVTIYSATDALRFSASQGTSTETSSTLQSAITDNEAFTFTITPKPGQTLDLRNAEFQFTWNREEYHTVRKVSVFSSIGGFAAGQQIFTTVNTPDEDALTTTTFRLPETSAYSGITAPVEFRLYLYGSQYGHKCLFHGIKLTRAAEYMSTPYDEWLKSHPTLTGGTSLREADPDGDGLKNFLEYALNSNPSAPSTTPPVQVEMSNEKLRITFRRARAELTYEVRASSDLVTWETITTNPGSVSTTTPVTFEDAVNASDPAHQRRFLHLRVSE